MENKNVVLNIVEQALEVIKNLTDEEIIDVINNKREFVLSLKGEFSQDGNNRKRTGANKKRPHNEGRITSEKSKYKSNQNEKEDKKTKERSDKPSFEKVNNKEVNEFDLYIRELSRFRSKEEAIKYLLDNKLTVTKLKILAKKLSIYIKSKSKKIDIIEAIVEDIVGSMLKLEALREY